MKTPANIARHPIHPMLVAIPIGLWIFSVVCDLVFLALDNPSPNWKVVAYYTMAGGIVGALIAAVPGLIDMHSLPPALKRIALMHMAINLTVVGMYVVNFWMRSRGVETMGPVWLSVIAVGMLGISGWLGGKMVYVHGVAVDTPPQPAAGRSAIPEAPRH